MPLVPVSAPLTFKLPPNVEPPVTATSPVMVIGVLVVPPLSADPPPSATLPPIVVGPENEKLAPWPTTLLPIVVGPLKLAVDPVPAVTPPTIFAPLVKVMLVLLPPAILPLMVPPPVLT